MRNLFEWRPDSQATVLRKPAFLGIILKISLFKFITSYVHFPFFVFPVLKHWAQHEDS